MTGAITGTRKGQSPADLRSAQVVVANGVPSHPAGTVLLSAVEKQTGRWGDAAWRGCFFLFMAENAGNQSFTGRFVDVTRFLGRGGLCLLGAPTGTRRGVPLRTGVDRRPWPCTVPAVGPQSITSAAGEGAWGSGLGLRVHRVPVQQGPQPQCQRQSRGVCPDPASRPARGGRQPTAGAQRTPGGDTGAVQAIALRLGSRGTDPTARALSVSAEVVPGSQRGRAVHRYSSLWATDEGCGNSLVMQLIRWRPTGRAHRQ